MPHRGHPRPGARPGPAGGGRAGPAARPVLGPGHRGAARRRGGRPAPPGRHPRAARRPTGEQLDAWLELAELVADEDFQRTTRANAAWGTELTGNIADPDAWSRQLGAGLAAAAELRAAGVEPSDPRTAAAVTQMTRDLAAAHGRRDDPAFRHWLAGELDAHTDPRAERYWQLVGTIQGRSGEEFAARIADHAWLMAALRRHTAAR